MDNGLKDARVWSTWRHKPAKQKELAKLEKNLRDLKIPHWSLTRYARYYQGAPDLLLPQKKIALWLFGGEVSHKQERGQAQMRAAGWVVIMPETAHAAMQAIQKGL